MGELLKYGRREHNLDGFLRFTQIVPLRRTILLQRHPGCSGFSGAA